MPKFKPPVFHYNRGQIQPIDFIESSFTSDEYRGYLKGQVIKYISRYRYKGMPISDLDKALVYLNWLLEFEEPRPTSETQPNKWRGGQNDH
ncbi:MAG: DUF3310 domain-containing protein [Dehalococcoidia bacterium]|nr:DUF3310 domain-containing protein [Dehalococcoidia bacterium]